MNFSRIVPQFPINDLLDRASELIVTRLKSTFASDTFSRFTISTRDTIKLALRDFMGFLEFLFQFSTEYSINTRLLNFNFLRFQLKKKKKEKKGIEMKSRLIFLFDDLYISL